MFKKTYSINNCFLYDYIYEHTKDKFVLFGYFFHAEEYFCGRLDNDALKVYCTDIALCFFNPMIIVEKINQNDVFITIKYNTIHYILIALSILIGTFSVLACLSFPLNILGAFILTVVILLMYKINYSWQKKKILDCLLSIKDE